MVVLALVDDVEFDCRVEISLTAGDIVLSIARRNRDSRQ